MANMLERLVFIDETRLKTSLGKTTGGSPVGTRRVDHAPVGHRHPQTFVAGLAQDGLIAPWGRDGPMTRASFEACVTHQRAPALRPGQIVAADNLSSHTSGPALALLRAQGNDLIFLPPSPPDLNPIGMAFSNLKPLIRKEAPGSCEARWKKVGAICDLFLPQDCRNAFVAPGQGSNRTRLALEQVALFAIQDSQTEEFVIL